MLPLASAPRVSIGVTPDKCADEGIVTEPGEVDVEKKKRPPRLGSRSKSSLDFVAKLPLPAHLVSDPYPTGTIAVENITDNILIVPQPKIKQVENNTLMVVFISCYRCQPARIAAMDRAYPSGVRGPVLSPPCRRMLYTSSAERAAYRARRKNRESRASRCLRSDQTRCPLRVRSGPLR